MACKLRSGCYPGYVSSQGHVSEAAAIQRMHTASDTPTVTPPSQADYPPSASRWWKLRGHSAFSRYAALSLIGSICAAAAPLLPLSDSYLRLIVDLAGHFVWVYFALALVIAFVSKSKARWLALAAVPLCGMVLANAYRASETPATASIAAKGLHVMSVNVQIGNPSPERFLQLLADVQPEVVFVQEVSPEWAEVLYKLPAYPYKKIFQRRDSFGIALLSKHPFVDATVQQEGEYGIPAILATLTWHGTKVDVRAVHPHPPISTRTYVARNSMLANHATALVSSGRPAIMAGDFNATPWSAGVSVVQDSGLVRATSLAPTWPAHAVVPAVIPIDHITVSKHWGVLSNGRGPNIGSDHFPVMATVYLK